MDLTFYFRYSHIAECRRSCIFGNRYTSNNYTICEDCMKDHKRKKGIISLIINNKIPSDNLDIYKLSPKQLMIIYIGNISILYKLPRHKINEFIRNYPGFLEYLIEKDSILYVDDIEKIEEANSLSEKIKIYSIIHLPHRNITAHEMIVVSRVEMYSISMIKFLMDILVSEYNILRSYNYQSILIIITNLPILISKTQLSFQYESIVNNLILFYSTRIMPGGEDTIIEYIQLYNNGEYGKIKDRLNK